MCKNVLKYLFYTNKMFYICAVISNKKFLTVSNIQAMISKTDMNQTEQIISIHSGHFDIDLFRMRDLAVQFIQKHWLNAFLAFLLVYVVFTKDIHFSVHLNEDGKAPIAKASAQQVSLKQKVVKPTPTPKPKMAAAALVDFNEGDDHDPNNDGIIEMLPTRPMKPVRSVEKTDNGREANLFNNIAVFENAAKADPSVIKGKKDKCQDYVSRFINVARAERSKFGIPVSVTLAQGLLESDAGDSRLTRSANNHFGIKTFNSKVAHVVLRDDTPKDKFKKYGSAWESYRDHSMLLMKNHYKHLQFLSKTDYAGWAKGLQKAGYATDKQYATKLVQIIENLQLYRFDEV
jgi:flagellum-specific peptidoglycan hydrolase FlgJ